MYYNLGFGVNQFDANRFDANQFDANQFGVSWFGENSEMLWPAFKRPALHTF